MNTQKELLKIAKNQLDKAYAPYSKFNVSAVIIGENGQYYTGVNVENASFGLTLCAEASAIAQMVTDGETQIKSILITSSGQSVCLPCGACRQRIKEFANKQTTVYLCDHEKITQSLSIDELLPGAFNLSEAMGIDYV